MKTQNGFARTYSEIAYDDMTPTRKRERRNAQAFVQAEVSEMYQDEQTRLTEARICQEEFEIEFGGYA